jgi:hypothetical protein
MFNSYSELTTLIPRFRHFYYSPRESYKCYTLHRLLHNYECTNENSWDSGSAEAWYTRGSISVPCYGACIDRPDSLQ